MLGELLECSLYYNSIMFGHKLRKHQKVVPRTDLQLLTRRIEEEELEYKCTECGAGFLRVEIHMRSKHADQTEGYCRLCRLIVYKGSNGLLNHKKRINSDLTDWAFSSDLSSDHLKFVCDKKFLTESSAVFQLFQHQSSSFRYQTR